MNTSITLKEFSMLVTTVGRDVTIIGQGEPGIGKSAMLPAIAAALPGHTPVYVDAALLDLGDLQLPAADLKRRVVEFLPNALFVSQGPVVLMIDEIGKAPRPVQNALLPLLLERRIGGYRLPEGSVVFGTTNLASDGVGDKVEAHARNRVCWVTVAKPGAEGWVEWAMDNDIAPEVAAWVREYPHCLASYADGEQQDNPYIFDPKRPKASFVTPRSLAKASRVVQARMYLTHNAFLAALIGTVGESAARDMQAFIALADQLPERARMLASPEATPVPENPIAQTIMALGAVVWLDKTTVTPWLKYLQRMNVEVQALFATQIMKSKKVGVVVTNKLFTDLCQRQAWVF